MRHYCDDYDELAFDDGVSALRSAKKRLRRQRRPGEYRRSAYAFSDRWDDDEWTDYVADDYDDVDEYFEVTWRR